MSKQIKGKIVLIGVLLSLYCIMLAVIPVHANTDGTEGRIIEEPEVLTIQLGTTWTGVEFELVTDAGTYPQPVIVSETGLLTMELGGSTKYTLSALNSNVPIPDPDEEPASESETEDQEKQDTAAGSSGAADAHSGSRTASDEEALTEEQTDENNSADSQDKSVKARTVFGIPVLHLALFTGGLVLCIVVLIILKIYKTRRYEYEDEEEYGDDQ